MRFEHQFSIDQPIEKVWAFLMDVPRMAGCIPGATAITQIDAKNYDATVTAKIGPITAKFGCRITILSLDSDKHVAAVEISGKDSKIGGGVKGKMEMTLTAIDAANTLVKIVSEVDILGKIGQYGHGMIAKRADAMLDDFAANARKELDT